MKPTITILQFHQEYPNNDACLDRLFRDRFPKPTCPVCGRTGQYHKISGRSRYSCSCGKHHIFPKKGTIFERSDTDLVKWFFALFLFAQSRNGVAAAELQRELGVSYKCAWRIAKTIRRLMHAEEAKLSGEVEADDTSVGGRSKGLTRWGKNKSLVFGAVERKGKLTAHVIENLQGVTLARHIDENVARGSKLITDQLQAFKTATRLLGLEHETVNHSAKEYGKGTVHVNTVEGFFSQLKRSLDGTHHVISPKYLPLYLAEFQYRYNHGRREDVHLFDLLLRRISLPLS